MGYFTPPRLALLTAFSDLISLAFDKKDFYPPHLLELRVMPSPAIQRPLLASFRQRVTMKFQAQLVQRQNLSNAEVELQTWQELEAELLALRGDASPAAP